VEFQINVAKISPLTQNPTRAKKPGPLLLVYFMTLMLDNVMALQIAGLGGLVAAVGTQEPSLLMILNEQTP
jgi:hypothetical protein